MDVGSSFSIYGNLFGWYVNQQIVFFMVATGFWMIPYFFIFYNAIWGSRADGESFNPVSILVKLEYQIYISLFVIALFLNPSVSVSKLNFQYNNGVTVEDGAGTSGQSFDSLSTIAPDEVEVPPAWYGLIVFTHAFNGIFKAILPSSGEARRIMHQMQQVNVKNPAVQKEYESFNSQCLTPARLNYAKTMATPNSMLAATISTLITANETANPDGSEAYRVSSVFPGSDILKTYFYGDANGEVNFCAQDDPNGTLTPCVPIGVGAATLTPHLSDPDRSCNQWWNSTLREKVTDELNRDSGLPTNWFDNDGNLSEALDRISPTQLNGSVGLNNKKGSIAQWISEKIGAASTNFGAFFGEMTNSVLRFALPILQGIIAMFIIMVLPILIVFGCYSAEKSLSVAITFFGLLMLPAIWHVIGWLDQVLLTTLWPAQDLASGFFSVSRAAFNFIILSSYVVFTYLWIGLVSSMGGGLSRALSNTMNSTGGTAAASGLKTAARYGAKPAGSAAGGAASAGLKQSNVHRAMNR